MKLYTTPAEAITDMHERGFTSDFQLAANELLLVQQNVFIPTGFFAIVEFHRFWNPAAQDMDLGLIGVKAPYHDAMGILFIDFARHPVGCPPLIEKKLNELKRRILYGGNIENESL